jgi:hypothetical protein
MSKDSSSSQPPLGSALGRVPPHRENYVKISGGQSELRGESSQIAGGVRVVKSIYDCECAGPPEGFSVL